MSRNRRVNLDIAHRPGGSLAPGCLRCDQLSLCGGLKARRNLFDCDEFCECIDNANCPYVCRTKFGEFQRRVAEVGGFELNFPRAPRHRKLSMPSVVPMLDSGGRFTDTLALPAACIQLRKLFRLDGRPTFADRRALLEHYRLTGDVRLVVSGVSREQPIEDYWRYARQTDFLDRLAEYGVELVTVPNFSLFANVPREDNLYNMKRIGRCWYELARRGIPTALHPNATTDRDWERWADFLEDHPEIEVLAYEFRTGPANQSRAAWHVRGLLSLCSRVRRPLALCLRGGRRHIRSLADGFWGITFVSPEPIMKTRFRRRAEIRSGRLRWVHSRTRPDQPLNDLFKHNLGCYTDYLQSTCFVTATV